MDNSLKVFEYNGNKVRTVEKNGEAWFVAKDVCDILELTNPTEAIKSLDDDEKMTLRNSEGQRNRGGAQFYNVISESGLYTLIMRSNKPEAKQFRRWVTHEVLPDIHKHGFYATPNAVEKILNDPDSFIRVLQEVKTLRSTNTALQNQIRDDRPKVIFADAVDASKDSMLIGNFAKLLCQNGINVGQNRLFSWFRENGYFIACRGERWNFPKQEYVDRGLFEIKKSVVNNPDGTTRVNHTTKITGKGQIYFANGFLSGKFRL